ncbi:unnamed protein product, partial [Ectocarpus sp. 8 AP-2014]
PVKNEPRTPSQLTCRNRFGMRSPMPMGYKRGKAARLVALTSWMNPDGCPLPETSQGWDSFLYLWRYGSFRHISGMLDGTFPRRVEAWSPDNLKPASDRALN